MSLYKCEDQQGGSGLYGDNSPWGVEIVARKHCLPSRPSHHCNMLVKEQESLLWIQPVTKNLIFSKHLYIFTAASKGLYEHGMEVRLASHLG